MDFSTFSNAIGLCIPHLSSWCVAFVFSFKDKLSLVHASSLLDVLCTLLYTSVGMGLFAIAAVSGPAQLYC